MKHFITIILIFITSGKSSTQTIDRKYFVSSTNGFYHSNKNTISHKSGESVMHKPYKSKSANKQNIQQPDSLKLSNLMVKLFLEGSYQSHGTMASTIFNLGMTDDPTATDSIEINLWSQRNLNSNKPDFSQKVILHNNGIANATYNVDISKAKKYFIQIKHRNSVEIWSSLPVDVANNGTYDFSDAQSKAFSDGVNPPPMQNMGDDSYALHNGDINQDGTVDGLDMNEVDNNSGLVDIGYFCTDVNGDGVTDGLDMKIVELNTGLGLFMSRPF